MLKWLGARLAPTTTDAAAKLPAGKPQNKSWFRHNLIIRRKGSYRSRWGTGAEGYGSGVPFSDQVKLHCVDNTNCKHVRLISKASAERFAHCRIFPAVAHRVSVQRFKSGRGGGEVSRHRVKPGNIYWWLPMPIVEEIPSDDDSTLQPAVELPAEDAKLDDEEERHVDLEECERLKKLGNEIFSSGLFSEALEVYRKALEKAPLKPKPKPKREKFGDDTQSAPAPAAHEKSTETPNSEPPATSENTTDPRSGDTENDDVEYTLTSQVYGNAGLCLSKMKMYEEAVEYLGEAIRHNKRYTKAYLRRAECYYTLSKWSSAYGDYEEYEKLGGTLDSLGRAHKTEAKAKVDEEMQKMLGELKTLGNRFLNYFGLSTDNFKFDKDPSSGGYSMRFEK